MAHMFSVMGGRGDRISLLFWWYGGCIVTIVLLLFVEPHAEFYMPLSAALPQLTDKILHYPQLTLSHWFMQDFLHQLHGLGADALVFPGLQGFKYASCRFVQIAPEKDYAFFLGLVIHQKKLILVGSTTEETSVVSSFNGRQTFKSALPKQVK